MLSVCKFGNLQSKFTGRVWMFLQECHEEGLLSSTEPKVKIYFYAISFKSNFVSYVQTAEFDSK